MEEQTSKSGVWILQPTEEWDGRLLGVFESENDGQKFVEELAGTFSPSEPVFFPIGYRVGRPSSGTTNSDIDHRTDKPGVWIAQASDEFEGRILGVFATDEEAYEYVNELGDLDLFPDTGIAFVPIGYRAGYRN